MPARRAHMARQHPLAPVHVAAAAAGFVFWVVSRPGFMSPDGADQYTQAVTRTFHDWHPPFLPAAFALFLDVGGSLGAFTLLQAVGGSLLLAAFAARIARTAAPHLLPRQQGLTAGVVVALLLLPPSPLAFYLVSFSKDTAAALVLMAFCTLLIGGVEPARTKYGVAAMIVLAIAFALLRHNGWLLLPALGAAIGYAARALHRRAWILGLLPLALAPLANAALTHALDVDRRHQENAVMLLDLTGLLHLQPAAGAELPYTAGHLTAAFPEGYRYGDLTPLLWAQSRVVRPDAVRAARDDRLRSEYLTAWRTHPTSMFLVKLRGFNAMLGWDATHSVIDAYLFENPFGLRLNERFGGVRDLWVRGEMFLHRTPLRWVYGVHGVWIVIGVVVGIVCVRRGEVGLALVVALGLLYCAGYLAAATAPHYRLMYPGALIVHAVVLTLAAVRVIGLSYRTGSRLA